MCVCVLGMSVCVCVYRYETLHSGPSTKYIINFQTIGLIDLVMIGYQTIIRDTIVKTLILLIMPRCRNPGNVHMYLESLIKSNNNSWYKYTNLLCVNVVLIWKTNMYLNIFTYIPNNKVLRFILITERF